MRTYVVVLCLLILACTPSVEQDTIEGLDTPWAIDFLPDGTMIFTERGGRVSITTQNVLAHVGMIEVSQESESGLHGIAVDPNFNENNYIYLYYTHETANRVSRFILNDELTDETILLDDIPSARYHDGGRIKIGPDQKLYIATGDATDPTSAQDTQSLAGKILRMNLDGSIPEDNPFDNYVYSYGHRNPQGIAWDEKGVMYASEHGPNRHDEINIIERGGNYGWPDTCGENPQAIDPIRCYTEFTLAPSGIAWHNGALYVTGLRGAQLREITLENGEVVGESIVAEDMGRLREAVSYEDELYIATSNRDGRGVPRLNDDRIIALELQ